MVIPTKEVVNGKVIGSKSNHNHQFIHAENGFDIYVDKDGNPVEEYQKVFECSCGAFYIEYTILSCKDTAEELAEEIENELEH